MWKGSLGSHMTAIHMPVLLLQDGYIVFSIYPPAPEDGRPTWKAGSTLRTGFSD